MPGFSEILFQKLQHDAENAGMRLTLVTDIRHIKVTFKLFRVVNASDRGHLVYIGERHTLSEIERLIQKAKGSQREHSR